METEAESGLAGELLAAVEPAIAGVVRQKLRVSLGRSDRREQNLDALDVLGEIRLKLLERLRRADAPAVAEFQAYAATVAYHACSDYLRAKYPKRTSLKNLLRRLLDKADGYACWISGSGEATCGYAGWRHRADGARASEIARLKNEPGVLPEGVLPKVSAENLSALEWLRLLDAVFDRTAAPVALDDLIAIVGPLCGIEDVADLYEESSEGFALDRLAGTGADPYGALLCAERLKLFWGAVLELLPWHRAAYLLNLRDGDLEALPYYGVVSVEGIAAALALTEAQMGALEQALGLAGRGSVGLRFAACWKYLPLEDKTIAATLGVTRTQVIAYRNKARERLARSLKAQL